MKYIKKIPQKKAVFLISLCLKSLSKGGNNLFLAIASEVLGKKKLFLLGKSPPPRSSRWLADFYRLSSGNAASNFFMSRESVSRSATKSASSVSITTISFNPAVTINRFSP